MWFPPGVMEGVRQTPGWKRRKKRRRKGGRGGGGEEEEKEEEETLLELLLLGPTLIQGLLLPSLSPAPAPCTPPGSPASIGAPLSPKPSTLLHSSLTSVLIQPVRFRALGTAGPGDISDRERYSALLSQALGSESPLYHLGTTQVHACVCMHVLEENG